MPSGGPPEARLPEAAASGVSTPQVGLVGGRIHEEWRFDAEPRPGKPLREWLHRGGPSGGSPPRGTRERLARLALALPKSGCGEESGTHRPDTLRQGSGIAEPTPVQLMIEPSAAQLWRRSPACQPALLRGFMLTRPEHSLRSRSRRVPTTSASTVPHVGRQRRHQGPMLISLPSGDALWQVVEELGGGAASSGAMRRFRRDADGHGCGAGARATKGVPRPVHDGAVSSSGNRIRL